MKEHNYIPRVAKIVAKSELAGDVIGLRLKMTDRKPFIFHPGQFIMLSVFGYGEVPIGVASAPNKEGYFEVAVRSAGRVTQKICSLGVGDKIGVGGPFGNGFPLAKLRGKDVVLISGGIGLPPLRSLIQFIEQSSGAVKSLTILNGDRSEARLLYREEYPEWEKFAKVYLTVDSCKIDWGGCVGNITKLFDRAEIKRGSVIIVCGPPIMFPAIVARYAGKTVAEADLYFLLERRLKCGIGKCQHCTCGDLYVCLDGPVFSYDQLKYNREAFK
jgi:NAD(P)H-flavin reductase